MLKIFFIPDFFNCLVIKNLDFGFWGSKDSCKIEGSRAFDKYNSVTSL